MVDWARNGQTFGPASQGGASSDRSLGDLTSQRVSVTGYARQP